MKLYEMAKMDKFQLRTNFCFLNWKKGDCKKKECETKKIVKKESKTNKRKKEAFILIASFPDISKFEWFDFQKETIPKKKE
jgi:hypothetical protein